MERTKYFALVLSFEHNTNKLIYSTVFLETKWKQFIKLLYVILYLPQGKIRVWPKQNCVIECKTGIFDL